MFASIEHIESVESDACLVDTILFRNNAIDDSQNGIERILSRTCKAE